MAVKCSEPEGDDLECQCGYKGEPEFGEFKDEEYPSSVALIRHIRCPECKGIRHITIEPWERIEMALRYPEYCARNHKPVRKVVDLISTQNGEAAYSIHCPYCDWGEGGGFLPKKQVAHLKQVMLEVGGRRNERK